MQNNSDVDVNVLVTLYNKKLSTISNQNVLLEAKLETLKKDFLSNCFLKSTYFWLF